MSRETWADLIYVASLFLLAWLLLWIMRGDKTARAERAALADLGPLAGPGLAEDGHDVGPDALRLLEDLERHLKAYGAAVADLYDTSPGER